MPRLRSIHLGVGIIAVALFLITGQYMHWAHDHLQGMPDAHRLFYRSSHIYLLWSSLLNVILGSYLIRPGKRNLRHVQSAASFAMLAGPFMLCASFFTEMYNPALLRPMGRWAIYLSFGGVLVHAVIAYASRAKNEA